MMLADTPNQVFSLPQVFGRIVLVIPVVLSLRLAVTQSEVAAPGQVT